MRQSRHKKLVEEVEARFAEFIGTKYAVITTSGRAALKLAMLSLNVKEGNVIIPNLVCPVVPQTILSCGLKPFVVDIDRSLSMDLECLQRNKSNENKIIVPVYLYGCPAKNTRAILEFARDNKLFVVEDAAQSFGAKIDGKHVGALGDVGVFSLSKAFFGLFRGGVMVTNNEEVLDRALKYRTDEQASKIKRIEMAFRYFKAGMPAPVKHLYYRLYFGAKRNPAHFISYDTTSEYFYLDKDYPYFYQNLMDFELRRCLKTLKQIEKIKRQRGLLVKDIIQTISQRNDMETLSPYNSDFVYSRIPVFTNNKSLSAWLAMLAKSSIHVDMVYRPLARNVYFQSKCLILPDYQNSEHISHHLLPLPLDDKLVSILGRR